MLFVRQIWTLVWKNILIVLVRHPITTPLRALVLPIVFGWLLSYARNFFIPPSTYGIGQPQPVAELQTVFGLEGRTILALVNNGHTGGEIDKIIDQLAGVAAASGKDVEILGQEADLLTTCRSTLRGTSNCFGAAVFYSSPTEGAGGIWNYTLKADGSLGTQINVDSNRNDQEVFVLPLQHAVDYAIAALNSSALPLVQEYSFTSMTQDQRNTAIRVRYMGALIDILGVAFFVGICGILYQQVGLQAAERELGMSQLLESMMPNRAKWQPQAARLLSYHAAFTIMFLPGWIILAIILQKGVFARTSMGILIVLHLLEGLSLASFSLFVGSFFRKAQLSGITAIILCLLLAVLAQVYDLSGNGVVAACSLLFPSMNYTFFIILMARWEAQDLPTDLVKAAPDNPWTVTGIVLWVFLIIQIVAYPLLAALVEKYLWGTSTGRHDLPHDSGVVLELQGFCKHYRPSWLQTHVFPLFGREKKETVLAADNLNLSILQGQLTVLVGANGCGKSTTLDAISGLSRPTKGAIALDPSHGIGLCPQKNVHWSLLSVYEHVDILNRLKSVTGVATKEENIQLIRDCDLDRKIHARAASLSGGQMRKLQLSMMFTGGSRLCLVDEVSSGIDPLARRRIQEILLAERSRSKRTIIFTSHFLDEADIADRVVIMSKGKIRVDGTGPQVKQAGVYRVHVHHGMNTATTPRFAGAERVVFHDQTVYTVSTAAEATDLLARLEETGWHEYHVSGPTIEDAFLKVAEEMVPEASKLDRIHISQPEKEGSDSEDITSDEESERELQLQNGSRIGPFRQGLVLFRKRLTVFRRNFLPNTVAFLVMPVATGLVCLFINTYPGAGCSPSDQFSASDVSSLTTQLQSELDMVLGPASKLSIETIQLVGTALGFGDGGNGTSSANGTVAGPNLANLTKSLHFVDSLDSFNAYIAQNYQNVTPGGAFFGDQTTIAFRGNGAVALSFLMQNVANIISTNIPIAAQYSTFDIPWQADQGKTLQFCVYLGLALSVYPAFFALYPTLERLRNVRSLHYSNGVRPIPLWLAYLTFDFLFVLLGSAIAIIILAAVTASSHIFYSLGHLFVVFVLYGVTSALISYVVSLFAKSQLASFAIAAAYQDITLLLYMVAFLSVFTYAPVNQVDNLLLVVHYTLSLIFPSGSLMRSLFVSLNELSVNCRGPDAYVPSPADFSAYGAPILYLLVQSVLLFGFLIWWDSGARWSLLTRKGYREPDFEQRHALEPDVLRELQRVETSTDDGLKVLHLSKAYGKNVAVQDVSFGIKRGEVFALLGPNGAGKSTTVSCIRGDTLPSSGSGDITIEGVSMLRKKAAARQLLGNCPQYDAMDQLTVLEHLRFYARIRGVKDVEANVKEVIRGVGLGNFQNRMASALSGGNKRKLSLGIALMGNPAVMLLDEISSGLDVAAKRILWKTLETVVPGRSIALITHSMEEADRLCRRAAIMAKKMLAVGTTDYLRKKHGNRYHVHLLLNTAPHTTPDEAARVLQWVAHTFPAVELEEKAFHGQIRFSVPADPDYGQSPSPSSSQAALHASSQQRRKVGAIAKLFRTLEESKTRVGFEYYSVSQTTLDQVFLSIVGKHNVQEENYAGQPVAKKSWWKR